ncbi:MAG: winged helix-turn-helix transcriptional regulator [Candidatus Aenigmarchaeota archaeon]|nr:winged helix-turn-helix transcriptional regulator [Candidatus Aenigmarchaeota archaeon]
MTSSCFNKHEKAILKILYSDRRPMNIKEISEKTGICWVTARKYTNKLGKEGWITEYRDNPKGKKSNVARKMWKFDLNVISIQ